MRVVHLSLSLFVFLLIGLTGCDSSSSETDGNFSSANGWQYGTGTGTGGGFGGVVGPGSGQPVGFEPGGGGGGNDGGGGGGGDDGGTPPTLYDNFLYITSATDSGGGNIASLGVGPTGALTLIGTDQDLSRPGSAVRSPDGDNVYLLDIGLGIVRSYEVNRQTGQLTVLAPDLTDFPALGGLEMSPDGEYVYMPQALTSSIAILRRGADGRLTEVASTPVPSSYRNVTISPDSRFLYATGEGPDRLDTFARDQTTGALTLVQTSTPEGSRPFKLTFSQSGDLAFVPYGSSSFVSIYSVDTSTGLLTDIGDFPTVSNSYIVVQSPTLPVIYVCNYLGTIEVYSYTDAGVVTLLQTLPNPGLGGILTFTPDGDFTYFSNYYTDGLTGYTVAADGTLTDPVEYGEGELDSTIINPGGGVSIPSARRVKDQADLSQ